MALELGRSGDDGVASETLPETGLLSRNATYTTPILWFCVPTQAGPTGMQAKFEAGWQRAGEHLWTSAPALKKKMGLKTT